MRDDEADEPFDDHDPTDDANEDEAMGNAVREDGPNGRSGTSFDPTPYLRQLRGRAGGQDYLDVKWRLLWLRREHPDAEIVTEHVQIDPTIAIFKATVTLPTGGKATGYGSETAGDFGDFIEKAETKAVGRALNALGYGAQFGERGADDPEAGAYPRPVEAAPAQPGSAPPAVPTGETPSRRAAGAPSSSAAPPPPPPPAAAPDDPGAPRAAAPIDIAAGRERAAGSRPPAQAARAEAPPARGRGAATATETDAATTGKPDADLADYSWTAFWPWARGLGLNGPKAVEALIGRPTAGLTPAELRDLIVAARNED